MMAVFQAHGRVQGVGYRYFVRQEAMGLDLGGWVRNEGDGSVSGEVGGEAGALEVLRDVLLHGTGSSRVSRLDWQVMDGGESLPRPFTIRS
jgi:acylphosphatase